jgi:hypothetical protein
MTEHVAFGGVTVDHLYTDCPAFNRARVQDGDDRGNLWVGQDLVVKVDPEGTDICGWCYRKWKGQHP